MHFGTPSKEVAQNSKPDSILAGHAAATTTTMPQNARHQPTRLYPDRAHAPHPPPTPLRAAAQDSPAACPPSQSPARPATSTPSVDTACTPRSSASSRARTGSEAPAPEQETCGLGFGSVPDEQETIKHGWSAIGRVIPAITAATSNTRSASPTATKQRRPTGMTQLTVADKSGVRMP